MPEKKKDNSIVERPPIIVIMGHIDHGKSTLLDYIRKSNIVEGEAGGITQHLSGYEVTHATKDGSQKRITFLDTPGHEAFSAMRSRGAQTADIAVLVVSAEDGVKQQTKEALEVIKKSGIPYIVAINKIDKPNANIERTKQNLMENEIYLEGFGGDTPFVPISAKTGQGVDELLDMMLLLAELSELTGDTHKRAEGVVIESNVDSKKGISATLVIKDGSLKKGSFVVAEGSIAPVRTIENFLGKQITEATFSSPIRITGWNTLPQVGSIFVSFDSKKDAEKEAETNAEQKKIKKVNSSTQQVSGENLVVPLIIKSDVYGTLEAIQKQIEKINIERIIIKLVHVGVGDITENDIRLVSGSSEAPIIIGFHVKADARAQESAKRIDATIEIFDIIYKITEWLEEELKKRAPKFDTEETKGAAKIIRVFSETKTKKVLGGKVLSGNIQDKSAIKIIRRENEIGKGKILELQHNKQKVQTVSEGDEFGALIETKTEIAAGDVIEAYTIVRK